MSKKKKTTPKSCSTIGCEYETVPGKKLCVLCEYAKKLASAGNKATDRGDYLEGLFSTGFSLLFNHIRSTQNPVFQPPAYPSPSAQGQKRPPQGSVRPKSDPRLAFNVLGLDPVTATEKQVRSIQKGSAQMWHEDKGGGASAQARLSEINEAASTCIKFIRARSA